MGIGFIGLGNVGGRLAGSLLRKGHDLMVRPEVGGGNISILAGGGRAALERALPVLGCMRRRILHTGALGSAPTLKVMTRGRRAPAVAA